MLGYRCGGSPLPAMVSATALLCIVAGGQRRYVMYHVNQAVAVADQRRHRGQCAVLTARIVPEALTGQIQPRPHRQLKADAHHLMAGAATRSVHRGLARAAVSTGSPHDGVNGLRSCHHTAGRAIFPSLGPTRRPSKKLPIRSDPARLTARSCRAAMGAAVSWARCKGDGYRDDVGRPGKRRRRGAPAPRRLDGTGGSSRPCQDAETSPWRTTWTCSGIRRVSGPPLGPRRAALAIRPNAVVQRLTNHVLAGTARRSHRRPAWHERTLDNARSGWPRADAKSVTGVSPKNALSILPARCVAQRHPSVPGERRPGGQRWRPMRCRPRRRRPASAQPGGSRHRYLTTCRPDTGLQRRQPRHWRACRTRGGGHCRSSPAEGEQASGHRIDSVPTTSADLNPVITSSRMLYAVPAVIARSAALKLASGGRLQCCRGWLPAITAICRRSEGLPYGNEAVVGQHDRAGCRGASDPGGGRQAP